VQHVWIRDEQVRPVSDGSSVLLHFKCAAPE